MTLEEQIRNYRRQAGMSQEKMAEKIGVSRQAVTKWENGTGVPDISNLVAIAELFQVSLDELLTDAKSSRKQSEFLYESTTEYDIDGTKNFDVKLGGAGTVLLRSYEGEKIKVSLLSNTIAELQRDYKIRIDDVRSRIDVDLQRFNDATEAQAKEGLTIVVCFPQKYIGRIEVSVNTRRLEMIGIESDTVEFDGKAAEVFLSGGKGEVELDCSLDMTVTVESHEGAIEINQISATSKIIVPEGYAFRAGRKGVATSIHYERQGRPAEDFSSPEGENYIELNGMKSELIISM
ncbi:MAG: helix-turn-helix domain-containing protein [Emergencia sp.]